jgi:serine/threonine-protein kinase RsbT
MITPVQPLDPAPGTLPLANGLDVVTCRQKVRHLTSALNFSLLNQTMLVTAASELGRNTVIHGGGGTFSWEIIHRGTRAGVRLSFEDAGPGIPDLERAMTNGWTSAGGLGLGLPGAKRLVDEFEVRSVAGQGTRVTITRWR